MLIIHYLEDEVEQRAENFLTLDQLKAHVEALHISKILQQVEVALKSWIFWIFQSIQLTDEELENFLKEQSGVNIVAGLSQTLP